MAGPPKTRGMFQYVFKHFKESFKVTQIIFCTPVQDKLQCILYLSSEPFVTSSGGQEAEGGDGNGQGSLWQSLLRVASTAPVGQEEAH